MNYRKHLFVWIGIGILSAVFLPEGFGQSVVKNELPGYGEVEYFEGEVIVRFRDHIQTEDIESLKRDMEIRYDREYRTMPVRYMETESPVDELLQRYRFHPDIEYIQPNFVYRLIEPVERTSLQDENGLIPNDSLFISQWGLNNEGQVYAVDNQGNQFSGTARADIRAPFAWEMTTGSNDVIIAIFDSGIDYTHPDLVDNLFVDQDGNHGIDTSPGTTTPDDPMDENGHGTHVAGIIGAVGNNLLGVSGVNWNVKLMAVRIFNGNNETSTEAIIQGFDYALENGAAISNHSYGALIRRPENIDLAQRNKFTEAGMAGHLAITAAGNDRQDNDDFPKMFPASYDLDNVISVAATDADDQLAPFSNFGEHSVHIAAPGNHILSTYQDQNYVFLSGTSMATPFVTGVAGLIKAVYPDATYQEVRERILNNADRLDHLQKLVVEGSRLNAFNSVIEDDGVPPEPVTDLTVTDLGQKFIDVTWTAVGHSGDQGKVRSYDLRISENPINESNFDQALPVGDDISPALAGEKQTFKVGNLEAGSTYYLAIKSEGFFENWSDMSNVEQAVLTLPPITRLNRQQISANLSTGDVLEGTFQISNDGEGPLTVSARGRFDPLTLFDTETRHFPYSWNTNFNESAPEFNWVEVSENGETIMFDNSSSGLEPVELPFSFPFYGKTRDSIYVSVNGFVSFENIQNTITTNLNHSLPDLSAPKNMIAVHWSNLELGSNSLINTFHDVENNRFIVEWDQISRNPVSVFGDMNIRFQLILYEGGAITMQYGDLEPSLSNITVGLNDATGDNGVHFSFNDNKLESGLAITFIPGQPDWFDMDELDLNLQPGENESIGYRLNASGLPAGRYFTEILLLDNDTEQVNRIPVELNVEGQIAYARFYNASVDPELGRIDLFVNGQLLKHDLRFNEMTEKIKVPADIDLDIEVYSENSETIDDPLFIREINFPVSDELFIVATGVRDTFLEPAIVTASPDFQFFIGDIEEQEIEKDKVRVYFFNAIADVDPAGVIGFYRDERPPFVIADEIPFGTFFPGKTVFKDNFDVDVVSGAELLKSFEMNLDNNGGETIVAVLTGFPGPGESDEHLNLIYTNDSGAGMQASATHVPGGIARHIPDRLELEQNFPNPFNPVTQIQFSIPDQRDVRVDIFDVIGRRVQTLLNENLQPGIHRIPFDGSALSSGVYFFRVQAEGQVQTGKMMLVK